MEDIFIQTQTLHNEGGLTITQNEKYVDICIGKNMQYQTSLNSSDVRELYNALVKAEKYLKSRNN